MYVLGLDIGGTKCAAVTATVDGDAVTFEQRKQCPTDLSVSPETMIDRLLALADALLDKRPDAVGISCGGPLDSRNGVILGPPNLPGWDRVAIVKQVRDRYGCPAYLQNDANACAVAEWKFGAGRGCENMIFLTFGTGLGAGLILNGRLYSGTNDNAGEVGHIRLSEMGPVGYGKAGSFEGFCSGGGLAQLGYTKALEQAQTGRYPRYFQKGMTAADVTAKSIAEAAKAGDETALAVYRLCGQRLGQGLSMLIDILNPERIVIGSVFARSGDLMREAMQEVIETETLSGAAACCTVVPAQLGEHIGDYGAIAVAMQGGTI